MDHLKNHENEGENQRKEVEKMIKVLEEVFSANTYGMFQCLYCVYGADLQCAYKKIMIKLNELGMSCRKKSLCKIDEIWVNFFCLECNLDALCVNSQDFYK
jgi:hypothetical protein